MPILGIDYGQRKIGLAIAEGKLAEPYEVIKYKSVGDVLTRISRVIVLKNISKVVVGVSEGHSEIAARKFGAELSKRLKIPVIYSDETLTTQSAQTLSIEAGLGRKKRKALEDAFAATVMLQLFVDENV